MHEHRPHESDHLTAEIAANGITSAPAPWRHVLVTTDLSPATESTLEAAADLARLASASVTVLHVLDLSNAGDSPVLRDTLVQLEQEGRTQIAPQLEQLCKRIFGDVPVSVAFAEGDGVSDSICRHARDHAVDLIVIATHGRLGAMRLLAGSVAERVVQQAPCDVLVVRAAPAAKA
jgi:universal stress protein A